ncbi:methionyl-tRNA formyltransferase [Alkanindiges hydrocarboniclasticus]|uniref:Methionyl-tRNA formyltransferase n=1 Tax=Alkanindiges hydrocarboniclasticus TaxID=1907941 RepID=A0A1S8CUX3_9GAMM|nr:methionyl-tRNA formyltransferase [Alkanindiges hydrocarboniclasticus]ONG41038.1 methionyl-tRNA formyltransferase [Alkanindiges hydrocarboniclasticus]
MKLIFAGTPEFAAIALQALIDAGHEIVAVYTQPDRPAGRGQKLTPSAVKSLALQHGLPVHQPLSLKSSTDEGLAAQQQLKDYAADVMVVAAYGLILPKAVLEIPRLGCLNIHASLLPRWRGAAPIQRALLAGDTETGITIMQMDVGLDTGDMLYKTSCPIEAVDTSSSLHDKLALQGGQAITAVLTSLDTLQDYQAQREVQDGTQASYAQKLVKAEARINWQLPASEIDRQIRAYQPWPVSFCELAGQTLRVWSARPLAEPDHPAVWEPIIAGSVIAVDKHGVQVLCGDHTVLQLTSLQWPGGKALNSVQMLQAQKIITGQVFQ